MKRIPEPEELMDEAGQALAYAEADFSASNELFLDLFKARCPESLNGRVIDLGCGPADIPIRFASAYPGCEVDAIDGAQAMLDLAAAAIKDKQLDKQISLHCKYLPALDLARGHYDAALSNSLLHHLNDPADLWISIAHCAKPGAHVLVMDLLRPQDETSVDKLVAVYAEGAPEVLRTDFRNSLFAAYTLEEVTQQLANAGLGHLEVSQVSDRHLAVSGNC